MTPEQEQQLLQQVLLRGAPGAPTSQFGRSMDDAVRIQNLAARQAMQKVDTEPLERAGRAREYEGQQQRAGGLLMGTAIPQFQPMAQAQYRQGLEAQKPWEIGEGVYVPGQGYVADPFKRQDRLTKAVGAQAQAGGQFATAYGSEEERLRADQRARESLAAQREHQRTMERISGGHLSLAAAREKREAEAGKWMKLKGPNDEEVLFKIGSDPNNPANYIRAPGGGAPGGVGGKPATDIINQVTGIDATRNALTAFETALTNFNPRNPLDLASPEKRATMQTLGVQLSMALKEAMNLGALTGPDVEILAKTVADPTSLRAMYYGGGNLTKQIEIVRNAIEQRRRGLESMYPRLRDVGTPLPGAGAPAAPGAPAPQRRANDPEQRADRYMTGG